MSPLPFLREPFAVALGWTLVHFVWQGALIALLLAVADAVWRKAGARVRYALACCAMALMGLSATGTFCWLWSHSVAEPLESAVASVSPRGMVVAATVGGSPAMPLQARFEAWLPWLDCIWLAGVLVLSVRSICGWSAAQRLKIRNTAPVDAFWERRTQMLAQALKISRPVRISKSLLARLPSVVGWFRPMILVPAGAFVGVDPQQLEALLAHELAHIRRHDYLVNLVQTAVETLLFYHPAVWWVGRKIRVERENCCDDLAVSACGDVLTYARALTRLEELRAGESQYAMAAGGGALLRRIRRLLAGGDATEHRGRNWAAGAVAALTLCAVWAGAQSSLRQGAPSDNQAPSAPATTTAAETADQNPSSAVQKTEPAPKAGRLPSTGSFVGDLAELGYANLTVDQLIAFKIHEVTPEFIARLREAGMVQLTPDQLVAFRVHGVSAGLINEWKAAGFAQLSPDQAVALQIHGAIPQWGAQMRNAGLGEISVDQLIAMKIHEVTAEFVAQMKSLGMTGLTADRLIAFRIHGVNAAELREIQSLGQGLPNADQAVALRIHEVTPEFVRDLIQAHLNKLNFDEIIAAQIHGITRDFIEKAIKHGFDNLTLDQLIQLKRMGIL